MCSAATVARETSQPTGYCMPFSRTDISHRFSIRTSYLLLSVIALTTLFGVSVPALCFVGHTRSCKPGAGEMEVTSVSQGAFRRRIICFGDSLTQYGFDPDRTGWLAFLAHWWQRRFDVVNRGFSGYNTRWAMALLDRLFPAGEVVPVGLVTIFFGANDAVLPGYPQHVPLDEYKENLKKMVSYVRVTYPGSQILLISPPPIHEAKWTEHRKEQGKEMDRKQESTMSYAKACLEVAQEVSVLSVNLFEAMGSGDVKLADKYFHDGVHFTSEGNQVLAREVRKEIEARVPELDPTSARAVVMQGPHWSDIDPTNPHKSVLRDL